MTTYEYRCDVTRTIDGDTVEVVIDLGFHLTTRQRVRLLGVDAPELFRGDDEERSRGLAAKSFVMNWVAQIKLTDDPFPFVIRTEKADSFGRWLGTITAAAEEQATAVTLAEALVEAGHAEWRAE